MRVLVVEDEQPLSEVFGEFLRGLGHRTLTASTAEAAMETLATEGPDAVLLDLYLPGMSGLDFLRHPSTRAAGIPIVAMSGIATEAQARECLRLGAVDFVGKPVVLERLGDVFSAIERRASAPREPMKPPERRRAARGMIALPILVRSEDGSEWTGTTVDVSAVGVRVRPDGSARSGSVVTLSIGLPDGNGPFVIPAVRVRADADAYAYDFLEASEAQRARLRGLVTRVVGLAARSEPHARILRTIGQATGASLAVDNVLDTALDALTHVTGHEISSLHLVSADGATLRLHGERGLSDRLRELNRTLPIGEGLIGRVAATGETVHYHDVGAAPDLLPDARTPVMEGGIRSFVCVAIQHRGHVLGTLSLGRRTAHPFSDEEIDLVEASANQIGLALENAKLSEETRRQLENLKEAETHLAEGERLSTLGKLAAGVAHEINNPLTSIVGQAELLLLRNSVAADAVERVQVIIRETSRAARLVQSMLQLARHRRAERRACSLPDQVQLVLSLKSHDLRHAGIDVATSFERVPAVWADEDQIRQVLLNLVQNAEHAMAGQPGRRELTVHVRQDANRARIEVLDTGPGIPADVLPRLFDAFFTTKPADKGTGLGLWVSYGIAEQHDGSLHAENRPDGGAAFILELPFGRSR